LGEIEAALREHPEVKDAAVMVREDVPGVKQLVAYPVGSGEEIRLDEYLRSRLPGYMVPGTYVWLGEIPLTTHGKMDRDRLPAPEMAGEVEYVEPRNGLEAKLAEMWGELLGVEEISVRANFFDLGGNSLMGASAGRGDGSWRGSCADEADESGRSGRVPRCDKDDRGEEGREGSEKRRGSVYPVSAEVRVNVTEGDLGRQPGIVCATRAAVVELQHIS
jgi:hypothetical protein